jgi:hypothetical protein
LVQQVKDVYNNQGAAIDQLFNPAELRALQITDLPKLCIDYINSRVGTGFDNLLVQFGPWLQQRVTPKKFKNIVEYLQSPRSNLTGMAAAFTAWGPATRHQNGYFTSIGSTTSRTRGLGNGHRSRYGQGCKSSWPVDLPRPIVK